ncbi:unnamed protein product [Cuscuta europaea]|uniref:GATA-type domain-containing protein n=1 Tax=Cuscuta europaea TaxID=41803 RepID=A0A9P0YU94_CUSEU|nr:unnamed protein product [Cuscuta europaea]
MAAWGLFIDGGNLLPVPGDAQFSAEHGYAQAGNSNNFPVDDLLDFSTEDDDAMTDGFFHQHTATGDSSTVTCLDSCNSSVSGGCNFDATFTASEICVPYEDLAELEWLSNFVEESFSSDEFQNLQLISAANVNCTTTIAAVHHNITGNNSSPPPEFPYDVSVPGKARSKRSRASGWPFRLQQLPSATSSSDSSGGSTEPAAKRAACKRRESSEIVGRKCLHCASDKTPQWRTGPLGPKTLCNACGVRYKSGRLVPEYRPAASPTFESAKHSNSHRKVVELRRQKEFRGHHHEQQQVLLLQPPPVVSQASIYGGEDYLLQHLLQQESGCTDFRHMV